MMEPSLIGLMMELIPALKPSLCSLVDVRHGFMLAPSSRSQLELPPCIDILVTARGSP
ncbi:hypothetical protein AAZX31_04G171200 [Glycine max]